jgi:GNAT superfamily N-acetyltransferase
MAEDVTIRRFRRSDEADALRLLLSKVAPEERDKVFEERLVRWRWQYYENPSNPEAEPILWVAEAAGAMVGLVCPLAVRLRTPSGLVGASWCNDWIVDKAHRGTGLGWKLEEAWVKTFPVALGRGWSERAYAVSVKLGLVTVGGFHRVWIVLSRLAFGRLLAASGQYRRLWQAARVMPRLNLPAKDAGGAASSVSQGVPEDAGSLWSAVSRCYAFTVERDPAHLKWRYARHPRHKYRFVEARAAGKLVGLAVVRLTSDSPPVGVIADVIANPGDKPVVRSLLAASLDHLRSAGACAVVADFPPAMADCFAAVRRPALAGEIKILVSDNNKAFTPQGIFEATSWYLSMGDSDLDFSDRMMG